MSDTFDEWATILMERYKEEIERTIEHQFDHLTKEAGKTFLNLEITDSEYHTKIHRIMAKMTYLRSCLQSIQQGDISWYRRYLKTCLEQEYGIEDYPNTNAWNEFFENHKDERDSIIDVVKEQMIDKLSHY